MTRTQLEITLGMLFILITGAILIFYGFGEERRMAEYEEGQRAHAIEVGAALFEQQCSRCHGLQGQGVEGLCPPLNDRYFFDQRLSDVGWTGTIEDYIVATAASGRLASTRPDQYVGAGIPAMPAFSEQFGGPLREDQIRNIATFIANWESTAGEITEPEPTGPSVGTDITQELPEGDPETGKALTESKGCVACHITAPVGPGWTAAEGEPGIGERAETRYQQPDYTGNATSASQYLLESIVAPDVFVVEGFNSGVMPGNYGETLTAQETADMIAYMLTLR